MIFLVAAFFVLLAAGTYLERLDGWRILDFVVLAGAFAFFGWIFHWHPLAFMAFLVLLNSVLVLIVFGADIKLPLGAGRFFIR